MSFNGRSRNLAVRQAARGRKFTPIFTESLVEAAFFLPRRWFSPLAVPEFFNLKSFRSQAIKKVGLHYLDTPGKNLFQVFMPLNWIIFIQRK
ncbi:MAG: hypothetical protein ACO1O1_13855 [Adhaeribacter sp.]